MYYLLLLLSFAACFLYTIYFSCFIRIWVLLHKATCPLYDLRLLYFLVSNEKFEEKIGNDTDKE